MYVKYSNLIEVFHFWVHIERKRWTLVQFILTEVRKNKSADHCFYKVLCKKKEKKKYIVDLYKTFTKGSPYSRGKNTHVKCTHLYLYIFFCFLIAMLVNWYERENVLDIQFLKGFLSFRKLKNSDYLKQNSITF